MTDPIADTAIPREELTKPELVEKAAELGVPTSGTKAEIEARVTAAEHGPHYIGVWRDIPNYGCEFCSYATLLGSADIDRHIASHHPQEAP